MHSRRMTRPTVLSVLILAVFGMTITISSLSLSVSVSIVEGLQQPRSTHHQQRRRNNVPINSSSRSNVPTVFSQQQNQQRQQIVGETTSSSSASTTRIMTLSATGVGGSGEVGGGKGEIEKRVLDTEAIVKYVAAITIQMVLFKGFFTGIDVLLSTFDIQQTQIPFAVNFIFFFVFSLKSRIFNPLSNERPQRDTKEIKDKTNNNTEEEGVSSSSSSSLPARKMPEWTPPGITFPIVWILLIAPLRAASSALLVSSGNIDYASTTILTLMFHLSIGDTWNTINNVERRYGTSCVGVLCVWLSAAFAAYSYGQVEDPALAGKLLSLPLIWLTIASSLIIRTWQLNPNPDTGQKESLLPTKPASQEGSITKLVWFEKEE